VSTFSAAALLRLEPLAVELQCPAVLCDSPDYVIWSALRRLSLYFQSDSYCGTDRGVKVSDHFLGDAARVAAYTGRIKVYTPVESFRLWRFLRCDLVFAGNA
jgi:hypothetical protein